jgi:hypothetical protein
VREEHEQKVVNNIQKLLSRQHKIHALMEHEIDVEQPEHMERMKTMPDVDRDISAEIETATEKYNIAVCRSVGPRMMTVLPRELRDIVYRYLTSDNVKLYAYPNHSDPPMYVKYDSPAAPYFPISLRTANDAFCSAHWWQDRALGADIAFELRESWYRNSQFVFVQRPRKVTPQPLGVEEIIRTDRFKLGLHPEQLITNFTIRVLLPKKQLLQWAQSPNDVLKTLQDLFFLRQKARITVCIHHWINSSGDPLEQGLNALLQSIFPQLLQLRRAEYCLKVEFQDVQHLMRDKIRNVWDSWMRRLDEEAKVSDPHT